MRIPILVVVMTAAITGCATEKPPVTPDAAPATTAGSDQDKFPGKDPNKGNIQLGPKLSKLCAIPEAYFPFDSANLSPPTKQALDKLAACFINGAAKDERMLIVGHADPRGELEYNYGLGQRRAGTVEQLVVSRGVAGDRIDSSSQGETEATGTDEAGWAKDRRVDILLAD